MSTHKAHRFPVDVRWVGGRMTQVTPPGKAPLDVATPPEFRGGVEGVWSPEDLYVASAAACYAVTLVSVAERRNIPLHALSVRGVGTVTRRADEKFGFTTVELEVDLETAAGHEEDARAAAEGAEHGCLVAVSLDVAVHVHVHVATAAQAA
jgi:organic hydroperoxide reductase OsmC/OhrA